MENKKMKYKLWKTNKFNGEILHEIVAVFLNFEDAKDFVEYKAAIFAERYAITYNGHIIDID